MDPASAPVKSFGNWFKVTGDLNTSLVVEKNDIVLDGQGFTLQGPGGENNGLAGIKLNCSNVTVANFRISGWQVGILGAFDNNTIISNNFTGNLQDVAVYANDYVITGNSIGAERIVGNNNVISRNDIRLGTYATGFWISNSSKTVIEENNVTLSRLTTFFISTDNGDFKVYHNNFLNVEEHTGGYLLLIMSYPQGTNATSPFWDDGFPSGGNFWSDYARRYPGAVEVEGSNIGSVQYVSATTPKVVDRYPLIEPYSFTKPLLQTLPSDGSSPGPEPNKEDSGFTAQLIAIVVLAALLIVAAVVYVRKRRT